MNWFHEKKILVPFDFSDESGQAIDTALTMTTADHIHVVHVALDLAVASPEVVWNTQTDEQRRETITQSFDREFKDAKYHDVTFHVSFGDPGHGIAKLAEEIGADVIVMPSHGRTGLRHLVIGSVAERVMRLAHCPVLVLRK